MRYLEVTIRTIRQLWSVPPTVSRELRGHTSTGRCDIQPTQQPFIPLLVAGAGEKVILRRAAEYADMVNLEQVKAPTPDNLRRKLGILRRYCDERGRPFDSMILSHYVNTFILANGQDEVENRLNALPPILRNSPIFRGVTPNELIAFYRPIIDAGVNYLYFQQFSADVSTFHLFAETVMPELQDYYASTRV